MLNSNQLKKVDSFVGTEVVIQQLIVFVKKVLTHQKRRGQAYGRGEYFGNTPEISMGYSKGNCHLILTYVLNSSKCKKINIGYVVDNPTKWDLSYCLPLLVITFNNGKPVDFLEKSLN
ncbi:Uncharacterized protein QTN25_000428 [Entamoeba marina]